MSHHIYVESIERLANIMLDHKDSPAIQKSAQRLKVDLLKAWLAKELPPVISRKAKYLGLDQKEYDILLNYKTDMYEEKGVSYKIQAIKAYRERTNTDLRTAKDAIENAMLSMFGWTSRPYKPVPAPTRINPMPGWDGQTITDLPEGE